MENKQAVKQLKALRTFHNQFIEDNKDIENSFSKQLVEALDIAIKALERTALEVPVQEQLINDNLVDAIVEKISIKIASALNN